jgi:LemA protein
MLSSGWFWLTIAIGVFWALGAYNRLMRLRSQAHQCFDALERQMLQFTELVQQLLSDVVSAPATPRTELTLEQGSSRWARLQESARQAAMALARMHEHPLQHDSVEQVRQTQGELQAAWEALIEPQAYRQSVSEALQQRWQAQLLLVQPDIERFNQAIEQYNQAIAEFPAALIARLYRFTPGRTL